MYKSVLLTLLLCIVFTTKSGRSEIYNVNRRKIADDHQSLQIFDCKGWVTLLSPWNKGKIEISSRKLQRRMRKTGKTNIRKKVKVRGMRFARVNGNCCWEVKEYFHGGETKDLVRAHTYHLPWNIRSVKLVAC